MLIPGVPDTQVAKPIFQCVCGATCGSDFAHDCSMKASKEKTGSKRLWDTRMLHTGNWSARSAPLSAYVRAMRCPVIRQREVLLGGVWPFSARIQARNRTAPARERTQAARRAQRQPGACSTCLCRRYTSLLC
eukprot:3185739-Rhodomonas_salina.1